MTTSDSDQLLIDKALTEQAVLPELTGKGKVLGLYISYLLFTELCNGVLEACNHWFGGAEFCLTCPLFPASDPYMMGTVHS